LKTPYEKRNDEERLITSWRKALKQFERADWSSSAVRVATAAEIAANIYIRHFFTENHSLPPSISDSLLRSANGLTGKMRMLIRPIAESEGTWQTLKSIEVPLRQVGDPRNKVLHSGDLLGRDDARSVFRAGKTVINALVPRLGPPLELPFDTE